MLRVKNTKLLLVLLVALVSVVTLSVPKVFAADPIPPGCPGTTLQGPPAPGVKCPAQTTRKNLEADCKDPNVSKSNCGIVAYLATFIKLLSGLVGVVVVIMIAIGGIQYSTARDNPQATAAAKQRIINAILGLIAYLFIFAFLQYIVPGGVL